jgi:pyruvate dehydrogenase E2 component (dihydrolipoamide acetyltransferase)
MSVSVSMPQLGESVTEGTVTRWLKREGDRVEADEPLLEVSTDKVDTEIPSPVSGILRGITVAEDETVAVGAELAVIDDDAAGAGAAGGSDGQAAQAPAESSAPSSPAPADGQQPPSGQPEADAGNLDTAAFRSPGYQEQTAHQQDPYQQPGYQAPAPAAQEAPAPAYQQQPYQQPYQPGGEAQQPAYQPSAYQSAAAPQPEPPGQPGPPGFTAPPGTAGARPQEGDVSGFSGPEGPYVTPLVRKLAAEHGIDLAAVAGTGVGGRIRKQDVLDAATARRGQAAPAAPPPGAPQVAAPGSAARQAPAAVAGPAVASPAGAQGFQRGAGQVPQTDPGQGAARPAIVPSSLRGRTEKMSRSRQVIAQRMVESLQTSAQLTTVVEADVTAIARLRERAKAGFEAREGVKLTFLPFFALAAVESLKVYPKLNAVVDTVNAQVTYHDAEHLGIAVDTDRGLMVPVIRSAGDLNIGGLARKIADLAQRTRAGQVSPDELSGGTFTLTNTGSRGALFDTPIINQPQVAILGTGIVVKRPVVVDDAALGEVITVRSMAYLALTYDHRLVDGADAARFLNTMKTRLEEGAFETELGL